MKNLNALSCTVCPKDVRAFARQTISTLHCSQCRGRIDVTGTIMVGHHPPCVYLMSLHVTRSPSVPPPYLHTASDQTLHGGGNGMGRGYRASVADFWA